MQFGPVAKVANREEVVVFLRSQNADLAQYPVWGELRQTLGVRVHAFGLWEADSELSAYVQVQEYPLPLGQRYWQVARGPVLNDAADWQELLAGLVVEATAAGVAWILWDWPEGKHLRELAVRSATWRHASGKLPDATLKLDLTLSPEELLAQMKPKGRYNIKVAEKHGVTVRETTDITEIKSFYALLRATAGRDGFAAHREQYYVDFLRLLAAEERASLWLAEREGQVLAGLLATYAGQTATYYYGASDHAARQYMAPYLLQWRCVLAARERGYTLYDFLGIAPSGQEAGHRLAGVTDFKRKFGGVEVLYPPARALVLRPLVWHGVRLAKLLRS
jgi:lipid II:glycine glycyltransferase (peptidoglycan interpeptide bridge formation enzyme)